VTAEETPLELAERALGHAQGDAQVSVHRELSLVSRFARSTPTQATRVDDVGVRILSLHNGHTGAAETNDTSQDGLRAAARQAAEAARAAARLAGGRGEHPGLPAPATYRAHEGYDPATARLDAADAGGALREVFAAAAERDLEAFGIWTAGRVTTALASTAGIRAADDVTDAHLKVVARDPVTGRTGWGSGTGVGLSALDPAAIARRAAAKVTHQTPLELAPGAYTVVLEADAVGLLLEAIAPSAFGGPAHVEGRSPLAGRLGTRVAASSINLSDSPRFARTLPRAFDAEGVPKSPLPLIQDGVAHAVVHDSLSASRAGGGARSTGHALAPGGFGAGPAPTNLVLIGGGVADEAALCAPVERGLYVTRLWYLNMVHERSGLFTGTTRDGTFLIEDGRISRPVRDVRFTDSPLRILSATEALGAAQRLISEAEFYGPRFATGAVVPPLRAQGFAVTGQTLAPQA
jgi:predicted Zn-dependent protease